VCVSNITFEEEVLRDIFFIFFGFVT